MFKLFKNTNKHENTLYNNIVLLSRNKLFYTKFDLADTFQNRIILIFIHISFIFVTIKKTADKTKYKVFFQSMFDLIFDKIELNMREIGHGDVSVNKQMKSLVKIFYNILLNCENFPNKDQISRFNFFNQYLTNNKDIKIANNAPIDEYFIKYQSFCFDLTSDSVLKGKINFKFK